MGFRISSQEIVGAPSREFNATTPTPDQEQPVVRVSAEDDSAPNKFHRTAAAVANFIVSGLIDAGGSYAAVDPNELKEAKAALRYPRENS
ncbi:MAG TPA: hypothetical protein VF401_04130 [Candidatus Saccharimonadales bacterium]